MPLRVVRGVARRFGRRGAFLALVALMWLGYGYGQLVQPPPPASRAGLILLTELAPYPVWAWLWILAAVMAFAAAPRTGGRDTHGFVALILPALLWMLTYLASWWPLQVFERGWVAAAIWAAATSMIMVVAGWPEPDRR